MELIPPPLGEGEDEGVCGTQTSFSLAKSCCDFVSQQCNRKRRLSLSVGPCHWVKGSADAVTLSKTLIFILCLQSCVLFVLVLLSDAELENGI